MTENQVIEAIEKNHLTFAEKLSLLGYDWKALVAMAWSIIGPIVEKLGPAEAEAAVQWIIAYIEAWITPPPAPPTPAE